MSAEHFLKPITTNRAIDVGRGITLLMADPNALVTTELMLRRAVRIDLRPGARSRRSGQWIVELPIRLKPRAASLSR